MSPESTNVRHEFKCAELLRDSNVQGFRRDLPRNLGVILV